MKPKNDKIKSKIQGENRDKRISPKGRKFQINVYKFYSSDNFAPI
jgi:hypothetical protein